MTSRDELARTRKEITARLCKKFDLPTSFIVDVPVANRVWMLGQVWDALIDAELRVQELREALTAIATDPIIGDEVLDPAALMYRGIAKRALRAGLSEEGKS